MIWVFHPLPMIYHDSPKVAMRTSHYGVWLHVLAERFEPDGVAWRAPLGWWLLHTIPSRQCGPGADSRVGCEEGQEIGSNAHISCLGPKCLPENSTPHGRDPGWTQFQRAHVIDESKLLHAGAGRTGSSSFRWCGEGSGIWRCSCPWVVEEGDVWHRCCMHQQLLAGNSILQGTELQSPSSNAASENAYQSGTLPEWSCVGASRSLRLDFVLAFNPYTSLYTSILSLSISIYFSIFISLYIFIYIYILYIFLSYIHLYILIYYISMNLFGYIVTFPIPFDFPRVSSRPAHFIRNLWIWMGMMVPVARLFCKAESHSFCTAHSFYVPSQTAPF